MFPTSGYFKNIPCPYYNTGACERPYCHFKHQKLAISSQKTSHIPSYTTVTDQSIVGTSRKDGSGTSSKAKGKSRSAHRSAALPMLHYQHEPFPTGPSVPVYKPTPIAELNRMHGTQKKKDSSTSSEAVISAQFQVIGQGGSGLPPTTMASGGDGDGPAAKDEEEPQLMIDIAEPSEGDNSLPKESSDEKDTVNSESTSQQSTERDTPGDDAQHSTDKDTRGDSAQQSTEGGTAEGDHGQLNTGATENGNQQSIEGESPSKSITITINTKRQISKKERREFADLFGDASDEEVILLSEKDEDSGEDVLEVPTVGKAEETVINLISDSSEDDCDWEEVKDRPANFQLPPGVSIKSENKSASRRDSRKEGSKAKSETVAAPITVSSSSNAGQCKELFEMFQQDAEANVEFVSASKVSQIDDEIETSRKRKARDAAKDASLNVPSKRKKIPTPQEVANNRFEAMKQASKTQEKTKKISVNGGQLLRKPDYNSLPDSTSSRTYKGQARKAHEPKSQKAKTSLERPRISAASKSKISSNVRQLKLDQLINECLRCHTDESEAYERAKTEEEAASARASSKIIYYNLISNIIKNIRGEAGGDQANKAQPTVSHEVVLAGKASSKFTVGLKRRALTKHLTKEDMHGDLLFKKLRNYVLSETQLVEQGYPRPAQGKAGHAEIQWTHYDKIPEMKGLIRICKRCGRSFSLTEDNGYVSREECVHHWGKNFRTKVHGQWDLCFSCCEGKPGSEGCTIGNGHVHESNKFTDLGGYMKTFAKKSKDYCGVYALDCEMVYTTKGIEIARVTVINDKLDVMLDSFIKPECEVIDYNTRFSGLTEENFTNVTATLKDIQAILLNMFQEDTVLIGHSLNSDLIALKLIHDNVVDTSMVWPHKLGLPYKRALKNLMLEILNKLIQESGSAGHDSTEDASACMELMKWKVHQDYMKDNR